MIIVPELIKTLDGLLNQGDSPIGKEFGVFIDKQTVKNTLDIIIDQRKVIERLQSILGKFLNEINAFENKYDIEDISEFSLIPILENENNNLVKQMRIEVAKELAERLKLRTTTAISCDVFEYVVRESVIDNIVKELEGNIE